MNLRGLPAGSTLTMSGSAIKMAAAAWLYPSLLPLPIAALLALGLIAQASRHLTAVWVAWLFVAALSLEMALSDLVVIWGTNPVNTQVNVMTHAARARKERGAKIAAIDIYDNDTMKQADIKIDELGDLTLSADFSGIEKAETVMQAGALKLPHIGWTEVRFAKPDSPLLAELPDAPAISSRRASAAAF